MILIIYQISNSLRLCLVLLFFCAYSNIFAQTDTLTAEQVKTRINKEVIVKANVAGTRLFDKGGKKTFLINLDKRFPQSPLTVVLYDKAYKELNLQYELEEKYIVVKGIVSVYNDRPQIIVNNVKNLKILK